MKEVIVRLSKEIPGNWVPSLGGRLEVARDFKKVLRPISKFGGANGS